MTQRASDMRHLRTGGKESSARNQWSVEGPWKGHQGRLAGHVLGRSPSHRYPRASNDATQLQKRSEGRQERTAGGNGGQRPRPVDGANPAGLLPNASPVCHSARRADFCLLLFQALEQQRETWSLPTLPAPASWGPGSLPVSLTLQLRNEVGVGSKYKTYPVNAQNDRWQEICQRKEASAKRMGRERGAASGGGGGYNFKGGGIGRPPMSPNLKEMREQEPSREKSPQGSSGERRAAGPPMCQSKVDEKHKLQIPQLMLKGLP